MGLSVPILGITEPENIVRELPRRKFDFAPRRMRAEIIAVVVHHSGVFGKGAHQHAVFHTNDKKRIEKGRYAGEWGGRGWPIFAYHGYVGPDAKSYRTNEYEEVGYHCSGHNRRSIGILVEGNFSFQEPTEEQLLAVAEQIIWHESVLGRRLILLWHDETKAPKPYNCPGAAFPRKRLRELVDSYYLPTTTGVDTEEIDADLAPSFDPKINYIPFISPGAAQGEGYVPSAQEFMNLQMQRWQNSFRYE